MAYQERIRGASIYPAVQNILLACRALGLGTVITTNHILYEDDVRAILGLPNDVFTFAMMPVGFPVDNMVLYRVDLSRRSRLRTAGGKHGRAEYQRRTDR